MVPQAFKHLADRVKNAEISPLQKRLEGLKKKVSTVEASLEMQMLVQQKCQYLANGETRRPEGFGSYLTYAMFVRQYWTKLVKVPGRKHIELAKVDMVIVPDLLAEQMLKVLRAEISDFRDSHSSVNTLIQAKLSSIVERMLKHTRNAKNVSVGTFADVLCEACAKCGEQVPVAAFDEHVDDDNGRDFTIRRLCGACPHVEDIASYSGRYTEKDLQYRLVDGIYQH